MTAGEAIILLNHNHRLTRTCWNKGGKVWKTAEHKLGQPPANYFRYEDNGTQTSDMAGNVWKPSYADLTAQDWEVLPD